MHYTARNFCPEEICNMNFSSERVQVEVGVIERSEGEVIVKLTRNNTPPMSDAAYTPEEVQAVLENAINSAEEQVEQLLEQEAGLEADVAKEAAQEIVEEAAAEAAEQIVEEAEAEAAVEAAVEEAVTEIEKQFAASVEADDEDSDEDSEYDDDDDFDPADETLCERIEALKDIFTPAQREFFSNAVSNITTYSKLATFKLGSALWYLTTTSMLVGVPLAVAILNETQLTELEKELNGGALTAPAAPSPAPEAAAAN